MSNQQTAGELVLAQLRASLDGGRYSLTAVCAALITAFGGSFLIVVAVLFAWHRLNEIYAPKPLLASRLRNMAEGSAPRPSLWQCLKMTWSTTEEALLSQVGLDAVVFLHTLRMMRSIFAVLTLLLFATEAPINIVFNLRAKYVENLKKKDALLLLTPSLLSGVEMIPHVVLGWVSNIVTFFFLWRHYRCILAMREEIVSTPSFQSNIAHRSLLITDLPKSLRTTEGVMYTLSLACRNTLVRPTAIHFGSSSNSTLDDLIEQYNSKINQLEHLHLQKPLGSKLKGVEQQAAELKQSIEAQRSAHFRHVRKDTQGLLLSKNLSEESCFAFVSFATVRDARRSFRTAHSNGNTTGAKFKYAPEADQIIWSNLGISSAQRGTKQLIVNAIFGSLLILWIIPSALIGCFLANLSRLSLVWPQFGTAMKKSPVGSAILQGVLAPLITTLVFSVLPIIFRKFSHLQGKVTRVDREHEVLRKLYAFFFIDNLFVFTILGVLWDIIAQVLQQTRIASRAGKPLSFSEVWHTLRVAERVATAVVNLSSFWVLYLLRGIIALFAVTAQPLGLFYALIQRLNFINKMSPRESVEEAMPQQFQYATSYLSVLFNATIAIAFATIQPLVLLVTLILLILAFPLKKYQLMHMNITKYESYGSFWPLVVSITLFALGVGNLILFCVVWVQSDWRMATAVAPLFPSMLLFKLTILKKLEQRYDQPETKESPYASPNATFMNQDKISLGQYYEHPSWSSPLETPLLTYHEALLHYTSHKSFDAPAKK